MTTSTDLAQRRLLEALANLDRGTHGGIVGLRVGCQAAIENARASHDYGAGHYEVFWHALDGLLEAALDDLRPEGATHD